MGDSYSRLIEDLKFALINLCEEGSFSRFVEYHDSIVIVYHNIVLKGKENKISVYYDSNEMGVLKKSKYLSKINTIKSFDSVVSAINYLKYLSKTVEDVKYELYHYFLFKLKELKYTYDSLEFFGVGNDKFLRCDISGLELNHVSLSYNFIFVSRENGLCELTFYPEKPLWNEGKICPESDINGVLDYISNLKVTKYEAIPLKEE